MEVILDFTESLFKLEGERVQKVGVIPPNNTRTVEFELKPLACIHKVKIDALISYRDAKWERYRIDMHPKEVHCVCPFLKGKKMPRSEFLELSRTGHTTETGLNFSGVTVERLTSFLIQTCKSRHYKVDDFSIENGRMLYLASESIGEKAYYLLTALIKEEDDLTQVMLRAVSDKPYGLNGFLNETVADLRHVVETVQSAREIGVIRKEQVINIIDSVVQRTTFGGGEGGASVNIKDSLVQRTEFKGDEEKKKRDGERSRKEREEQDRLRRQKEKEDEDGLLREKEALRQRQETKNQQKANEVEEQGRKTRDERERQRKLDAQKKEIELQEQKSIAHRQKSQREEATRIQREKESDHEDKSSGGKWFFGLILIFMVIALGWYGTQGSSSPVISTPQETSPSAAVVTSLADQKTITNSIGMEFVSIPSGEFDMGSPSNEKDRVGYESPVHHVTISNAFYLGKFEVTQKQWFDVMGSSPSFYKGDYLPINMVSWFDVQEFIKKLNEKEGMNKYRLPTEAEWEYAARAGTKTRYSFGDDESMLGDYAWYYSSNSGSRYHDVGQKMPNPWGLYDIHGNVEELVEDNFHENYNGAPTDGSSWAWEGSKPLQVSRGGSYDHPAGACRSANRNYPGPRYVISTIGFRLLKEM